MKKPPKYNPLRMGERKYADDYGKACKRYDKQTAKKNVNVKN